MRPRRNCKCAPGDGGFTVIELLTVMVLILVVSAIGLGSFSTAAAVVRGDAGMRLLVWQLKTARETAINQRRSVEVQFTNPNIVTSVRHEIPNGTTVVSNAVLEQHIVFMQFSGMPDTPSAFGNIGAVDFGSATQVLFTSEGQLVDQNGNIINGTIFLGNPDSPMSARAVTIFGPTAQIRTFRWTGSSWEN